MKKIIRQTGKAVLAVKDKVACIVISVLGGLSLMPYNADNNTANTALNNVIKIVFNILMVGGIVAIAYGAIQLFKALTSQDQGDAHNLTKSVGWIVGGVVMISAKFVVDAIVGNSELTSGNHNFFG